MKKVEKKKKIVKDVKSFTVERKNWYRGKGDEKSRLLNNSGKMCCLGFYALACGLDKKVIKNVPDPVGVVNLTKDGTTTDGSDKVIKRKSEVVWETKLVANDRYGSPDNSGITYDLMGVNDDPYLTDEQREKELTYLFKGLGIKVNFK